MPSSKAPGVYFAEAVGSPSTIIPLALDLFGLVGMARRGYVDRAVLVQSPTDFDREFGGLHGAHHLPLAVKGFFAQAGGGASQSDGGLLIVRNPGKNAGHGSSRVLDAQRYTTGFVYQISPGAYGKDVAYTTERVSSLTKPSAGNAPGTIIHNTTTEVGVVDPAAFLPGDVFVARDNAGRYAVGVVFSVDPAGAITFAAVPTVGGTVAAGARISTSSEHLVRTSLAAATSSGDTQVVLSDTSRVKVGQWLTFLGGSVSTTPVTREVESVSGQTVKLTSVVGVNLTSGSAVVSCEFGLEVRELGRLVERRRILSLSELYTERYVQEVLGSGATFAISPSVLATSSVADNALVSEATSLVLDSVSGLERGQFVKVVAETAAPDAVGVILQIKDIDTPTKTIFFDSVGQLGGDIGAQGTVGVNLHLATPTFSISESNQSRFIVFDEAGAKGTAASANPNELHFTIPLPVQDVPITGGKEGGTPDTVALVMGSNEEGEESGIFLFPKSPFFGKMLEFAIPGLADSSVSAPTRQALDSLLEPIARAQWDVVYHTHTPSDILSPIAAVVWRNDKLRIDSSWVHCSFDWLQVQDPAATTNIVLTTPRVGWDMGVTAFRRAQFGAHYPPANTPYVGILGLRVSLRPDQHALLNNNGLNAAIDMGPRGIRSRGARTLYTSTDDGTKRWWLNVRYWLQTMKKSIASAMVDIPFLPGSRAVWPRIKRPIEGLFHDQFGLGAFEPASEADAFDVQIDDETVTVADFLSGDQNVRIAVVPVGTTERVNFVLESVAGSVRTREVGGFRSL